MFETSSFDLEEMITPFSRLFLFDQDRYINRYIDLAINQSTNQSITQSINQPTKQPIDRSINLPTSQSIYCSWDITRLRFFEMSGGSLRSEF